MRCAPPGSTYSFRPHERPSLLGAREREPRVEPLLLSHGWRRWPYPGTLQRKEAIYADRAGWRYDHSVLVTAFDPGGFTRLPIVIERKTVAYLYADLHGSLHRLDAIRPAFAACAT